MVELVGTGPVALGAYTLAEIAAVNGVIDFIEREPAPELVAEAVRSLAARNLITTEPGADRVDVRGDLGIALAFQERSRRVVDVRVTGTEPDQPWRFLLMPQPEGVTLEALIDALGIHLYALRTSGEALERLWDRLPSGDRGPKDADADAVLAASPRTALITASRWADDGSRESTDIVLAEKRGNPPRLRPRSAAALEAGRAGPRRGRDPRSAEGPGEGLGRACCADASPGRSPTPTSAPGPGATCWPRSARWSGWRRIWRGSTS